MCVVLQAIYMLLILVHVCELKTTPTVFGEYVITAERHLVVNILSAKGTRHITSDWTVTQ